jgi:hypothetical protein
VSPMHKKNNDETPYVALALILWPYKLEQGHTVHAVFEVSIYNHSNQMYCGCKGSLIYEVIYSSTFISLQLGGHSLLFVIIFDRNSIVTSL